MVLLSGESLCKSFGTKQLFQSLSISVFAQNRIGLIGPNGSGKSTLLKILSGNENPDSGTLSFRRGLQIGYVPQTCEFPDKKPFEILIEATEKIPDTPDYERERLAKMWLSKLGFTGDEPSALFLSGGWKKRLAIGKEMITSPDLLLLDEPTNHLDIEAILWLEVFLSREAPSYILVSHDRYFLQHAVNRVIEISSAYPKGLFAIDGSYTNFLEKKEIFLEGQLQQQRSIASKMRREKEWLQAGVKARTTKSQARIDQAHQLIEEHADIKKRNTKKTAVIEFSGSERETRKLVVGKSLSKELNGKILFQGLDFTLSPGTRMGLMGPNGSGKTALLRILAGELEQDKGTLKRADKLQTVYFDQHKNQLPDTMTLREALSPTGDYVHFRGQAIHVNGWCQRFLFSSDILDLPIGKLSGGERARIAIAHLMLQPADVLLLDEPTNDLDIPTLEMLEANLQDFPGAIVLITHDRCMLDQICNTFLALGNAECNDLFASYAQWEAAAKRRDKGKPIEEKKEKALATKGEIKKGLSYMEKKEYESMEGKIEEIERAIQMLTEQLEDPSLALEDAKLRDICTEIGIQETKLEQYYLRWEELEKKKLL